MMYMEIVVYLTKDYSKHESLWVPRGTSKEEITSIVNRKFKIWYFWDIIN